MSPHAATFQEALRALLAMTTWTGPCWVDIERETDGQQPRHSWSPVRGPRDRERLVRLVQGLDERYSPEMALTLPRKKIGWGTVATCTILWCRVEGADQLARARKFKPLPTLVLQEGSSSRRLLVWALSAPLTWSDTVRANKRIAYRLGAVQKGADPDLLRIPVPGSCLRVGRSRPSPVVVARLDLDAMYTPAHLVKKLRDPPPADAWLTGQTRRTA